MSLPIPTQAGHHARRRSRRQQIGRHHPSLREHHLIACGKQLRNNSSTCEGIELPCLTPAGVTTTTSLADNAAASTIIFTVFETAKANGLNPEAYLNHILTVLPERFSHNTKATIDDLCRGQKTSTAILGCRLLNGCVHSIGYALKCRK